MILFLRKFVIVRKTSIFVVKMVDFETFIEATWDYVSVYVVSDKFRTENNEFIMELTYELYQIHAKSGMIDSMTYKFSPRDAGKILECYFSMLKKYKNTVVY